MVKHKNSVRFNSQTAVNLAFLVLFSLCIYVPFFFSTYDLIFKSVNQAAQPITQNQQESSYEKYITSPGSGLIYTKELIGLGNSLKIKYLGVHQINDVVIGQQGWLYVDQNNSMKDFMGLAPYSDEALLNFRNVLEYRKNLLARAGVPMLLVVAPNKETIYPEYLPKAIKRVNNQTRLDQFVSYFNTNTDIPILDLRETLRRARTEYPVYYMTDSHWNTLGAFIASSAIMSEFKTRFPNLPLHTLSDYKITINTIPSGSDLPALLFMKGMFQEQNVVLEPINPKISPFRRIPYAVVYHDSFYQDIEPWLTPYFGKVNDFWVTQGDPSFDGAFITREQPTIVIYLMVERFVDKFFNSYP